MILCFLLTYMYLYLIHQTVSEIVKYVLKSHSVCFYLAH